MLKVGEPKETGGMGQSRCRVGCCPAASTCLGAPAMLRGVRAQEVQLRGRFWVGFRCPSADPTLTPWPIFRDVSLFPISPCPWFQPHVGAAERNTAPVPLHPPPHAAVPGTEGTPGHGGVPKVKPSPQCLPLRYGTLSALCQLLGESLLPCTRVHVHAHVCTCACTCTRTRAHACVHM